MPLDIWSLYALMLKSRLFEEAVAKLWQDGLISGEMHLGTGEEAIIAGVVSHLRDGDAMALDHRGAAALLMRGVEPASSFVSCLVFQTGCAAGWVDICTCFPKSIWLPLPGLSVQRDLQQQVLPYRHNICIRVPSQWLFSGRAP